MDLTLFERLCIAIAIGQTTGTVNEVRTGIRLLEKIEFTEQEKPYVQFDAAGRGLGVHRGHEDRNATVEITPAEQSLIRRCLSELTGLPISQRTVALLDKFGV